MSKTVLVVDDETSVRLLVSSFLEREGFHVLSADDGDTALETFRTNQASIGLVLTDLLMPRMSGVALVQEIWQLDPGVPVLYMTGYDGGSLIDELPRAHTALMMKPFQMTELIEVVNRLMIR